MSYVIKQEVTKNNRTYVKIIPIGVLAHETATPGASDEAESKYFDITTRKAMVHFFVDWDSITQKVPVFEKVWGAGEHANNLYIQVEICHVPHNVSKEEQLRMFNETWKRSVWLFSYLLINYIKTTKVTIDTLPTHHDATNKWHETTHTDPTAYFAEYSKTIADFRHDVQDEINKTLGLTPKRLSVPLTVTPTTLHCRKAPTTLSDIIKDFHRNDNITAVGESGNWWELDIDGVPGYVSKDYVKDRV